MFIKSRILSYTFCLVLIYIYIYAPAFKVIPFGLDKILLILSIVFIAYKNEWRLVAIKFKNELAILISIFCISLAVCFAYFTSPITAAYDFLLVIQVIPSAYALVRFVEGVKKFNIDRLIINCSVIASLISVYLILNPETAYYFKSELLKYPEDLVEKFYFRGYGLSDGLTFAYPVIQGFCLGFILLGFYKNSFYYFLTFPILVSIFTNARSGLVPIFITLMMLIVMEPKKIAKILAACAALLALFLPSINLMLDDQLMLKTAFEWGISTFDIIGSAFSGEKSENLATLFNDMIIFPAYPHEWLMGSGDYLATDINRGTDIGYLLRLNYGGMIYLSLFFMLSALMFVRLKKINTILSILLFTSLIYLNFKGDFFIVNPSSRFFFLIYVTCILNPTAFKRSI